MTTSYGLMTRSDHIREEIKSAIEFGAVKHRVVEYIGLAIADSTDGSYKRSVIQAKRMFGMDSKAELLCCFEIAIDILADSLFDQKSTLNNNKELEKVYLQIVSELDEIEEEQQESMSRN